MFDKNYLAYKGGEVGMLKMFGEDINRE